MKYFSEIDVSSELVDDVFELLGFPDGQKSNLAPVIIKAYVNYIRNLSSYRNPQTYSLAKTILDEIAVEHRNAIMGDLVTCLSFHLEKTVQTHNDIAKSEIPAVVYTGDENDLPEIFSRINSKGTPLNAYEIYAASWPQTDKIEIRNSKIIDFVLAKYDALNDDIYTIQDYDREEIRVTKKVTLFEYVFGLGKWLSVEFPLIAFDKHLKADEVSPIGFELLDAIFFETKKIGEIYKVLQRLNINHLEKALSDCIRIVRGLSSFFNREFINQSRTLVADAGNKMGAIMAYSKMYPQGTRRKYWFAVHPKKIEQCTAEKGYYVFACSDDNIAVAVPMDFLKERLECLNVSNQNVADRKYYHMVLFVDGTKVSWLLSRPEIKEVDISHLGFHI